MTPTWWQLYGIGVLLVALIAFVLMAIWRRHNRMALDLGRRL